MQVRVYYRLQLQHGHKRCGLVLFILLQQPNEVNFLFFYLVLYYYYCSLALVCEGLDYKEICDEKGEAQKNAPSFLTLVHASILICHILLALFSITCLTSLDSQLYHYIVAGFCYFITLTVSSCKTMTRVTLMMGDINWREIHKIFKHVFDWLLH